MKPEDWGVIALWLVIFVGIGTALTLTWNLVSWMSGQPQVLAAVVSGAAVLVGGFLTSYLTQRREQRNELQKALRENYMSVLGRIDRIIRGRGADDDVSNLHLQTWVVGSPEVIEKTKVLIFANRLPAQDSNQQRTKDEQVSKALEELVTAMRKDVGLGDVKNIPLEGVYLFQPGTGLPR